MTWNIIYYQTPGDTIPGIEFLQQCPTKVRATILAVLDAVAQAPPPSFSGGGKWEAMHGTMGGFYEIRVTGPNRTHYRLFCILENATKFKPSDYRKIKQLGDTYKHQKPRPYAK